MIRVLEDRLVNQIAAGEVVERPASVVKELVENALDAGARHLRVTLKDGGRDLVQVEDDGHGMDRQDAMLCVERHATSKIATSEDLARIRTLGFRGEALPSIAAVSRFELTTRREGEETGTRVVIDGGRMTDVRDAGCPVGTRVTVRSLFYNLPARRKFLRTEATELQHCQDAVLREVLIRPGVGVDLYHDGRPLIRAAAEADAPARAAALLGREGEQLVAVSFDDEAGGGMQVTGLVSPPGVHHATTRGSLWLYVNGRPVRDPLMRRAVVDAFRGLVPKGRFPTVILDLRMPVEEVDVNVHPAKAEVRFRDGREVARALVEGLRDGLERQGIRPEALTPPRGVHRPPPGPGEGQAVLPGFAPPALDPPRAGGEGRGAPPLAGERTSAPWVAPPAATGRAPAGPDRAGLDRAALDLPPLPPPPEPTHRAGLDRAGLDRAALDRAGLDRAGLDRAALDLPPSPPPPERAPAARPAELRLVGQADERWLVCTLGEELLLVDQHRAHAAALALRLREEHAPLPLLAPVLVEAPPAAVEAVDAAQPLLAAVGVELDTFGGDTLRLRALPGALRPGSPRQLALDLAQALLGGADAEALRGLLARAGAVAPGTRLSPYEQRQLLDGIDPLAPGVAVRLAPDELARRLERG